MSAHTYRSPCPACDGHGRGRGMSAMERVRRCQQLEDHAHQQMLTAMRAPQVDAQQRASRKAASARAGALAGVVAVFEVTLVVFGGAWWLLVIGALAAVLAVRWLRRAVLLARPVPEDEDDVLGEAMRRHAAAVLDCEEAERRRDHRLDPYPEASQHSPGCESKRQMDARERMLRSLRPATPAEYEAVLDTWTRAGKPIRYSEYAMTSRDVMVVTDRMHVEPLHGASSFHVIIVPAGVEVTGTEPGHTDVVWTDLSRSMTFHGGPVRDLPAFTDAYPALAGR